MPEEIAEEAVVEEVAEEQQIEEEQLSEEVSEPEQEAPAPDLNMDFSNIIPEQAPPQEQEPDYDLVIENVVNKVLDKQKVKPEEDREESDDDDVQYMSKKDLAEHSKRIKQELMNDINQQNQAQSTIHQSFQESQRIRGAYAQNFETKLAEHGVDLKSDPRMKMNAELLYDRMKLQYAASVGRPMQNPVTGQIDPILTPQETGNLVKQHWDIFSKSYLGVMEAPARANTAPLGAGNTAVPGQPAPATNDDYNKFMEKKAAGNETLSDAMNLLFKLKK